MLKYSLKLRRLRTTDLFWYYKIVFGLVYVNLDDLFVFSPCQYTRGHKFKFFSSAKPQTAYVPISSVSE